MLENSSNALGEYCLIKIHIFKLYYFPIIGQGNLLLVVPEVNSAIEQNYLRREPLTKEEDVKITSLPSWLVTFKGRDLPQGDVRSEESKFDIECL